MRASWQTLTVGRSEQSIVATLFFYFADIQCKYEEERAKRKKLHNELIVSYKHS